jgi:hypothetical protein
VSWYTKAVRHNREYERQLRAERERERAAMVPTDLELIAHVLRRLSVVPDFPLSDEERGAVERFNAVYAFMHRPALRRLADAYRRAIKTNRTA